MRTNEEIGALLVIRGVITESQLSDALKAASESGKSLQKVLVETKVAAGDAVCTAIADDAGVPYLDLSNYIVDPKVVDLVPEETARTHKLVPVFKIENTLTVAMVDPTDLVGLDQVGTNSKCEVEACVSAEQDIDDAISEGYGAAKSVEHLLRSIERQGAEGGTAEEAVMAVESRQAPIARLVDLILAQAVDDRASDIHIEPEADSLRMRFRVDGVLYEIPPPPKHLEAAIISRVKVLADMDIATSRVAQDGHFQTDIHGKAVDVRVSSVPTVHGENLVLRLLITQDALLGLGELGFGKTCLEQFGDIISKPYGMILATGPTGSGKTTTLYAALNRVNAIDKNILTIEDPVEYRLPLIRQIQVNPKAGVTFAGGLRSILRQDPDIVMVGEIRDLETADIAVQAALTGHLVFSTLHTNDAASTLARLINMGVAPFLLSASVTGVIAQRLVRRLCPKCKEAYEPRRSVLESLGLEGEGVRFHRAVGCKFCKGTGYKDRVGVFELMKISDDIKELIDGGAAAATIMKRAQENGMVPLRDDGIEKALSGETSIEEVARVTEAKVDIGSEEVPQQIVETVPAIDERKEETGKGPSHTEEEPVVSPAPGTVDLDAYRQRISSWLAKR